MRPRRLLVLLLLGAIAPLAACGADDGVAPFDPADPGAGDPPGTAPSGSAPTTLRDGAAPPDDAATDAPGSQDGSKPDASKPDASKPDAGPPPPDAGRSPVCLAAAAGAYCGNDMMRDADPKVLYQCPGANRAPTSSTPCANGCVVAPAGTADYCAAPPNTGTYRLPWRAGTSMRLTQDCNDSCCADHVGDAKYAWDFANGGAFPVVAVRGGTVTHLKINSTRGCGTSSCANDANVVVVDHGDGTHATYLHLQGGTLGPGVTCGGTVTRGQVLGTAGTTGWSTGIHLHLQVSRVHTGAPRCECGADGQGCAANTVPWANFWSSAAYPTVAVAFDEWAAASTCGNRRIAMPASQN
ncbi:MAG TPA: M23 family metallopeptidase [Polyangiaceae bacterium]|nr:M23 family metallopeptidase [Polyangiaceae bacterium]